MHDAAQEALRMSLRAEGGGDEEECAENDATIYVKVMGTIIFVLVWPFIVLDMKWFPLGRPAAALVGAVLMVVFSIVSQGEVYEIEGERGSLQTVFLLVGMMILSYYFDREGLLRIVSLWIFGGGGSKPFRKILWKVCLLSAALSAFITNDAAVLVITPLICEEFVKAGRNRRELLPLTLGIATSANIGSAATVFGNPQNAFIASAAGVALIDFFIAELPAAVVGTFISMGMLHAIFFKVIFRPPPDEGDDDRMGAGQINAYGGPGTLAEERGSIALSYDHSEQPGLSSQMAKERGIMYSTDKLSQSSSMQHIPKSRSNYSVGKEGNGNPPRSVSNPNNLKNPPEIRLEDVENGRAMEIQVKDDDDEEVNKVKPIKDRSIREKLFIVWLCFISVLLVVLLAIPPPPTVNAEFNLGCIPMASAILTMLVDTIINRKYAYDSMLKIDWTVILMFMGLFIWLGGFQNTCFPYQVFNAMKDYMNLYEFGGVLLFAVFVLIGSNIFSNVPLTILIVNRIDELCGDTECTGPLGGLLLAWISTVAGNFTLIGSVANLIVAEKARSSADYRLTFWKYLIFGVPSTLVVAFGALPIVYFLGRYAA